MKNGELAQSHEVLPEVLRSMAFSEDISRQQAGAKHSLWQTEMTCSLHVVYSNNVQPCWPRLRHLDSCGKICPPTASNPFHSLSKDQGASVALWDPESTWLKKWRFATWAGRFAADSLWASDLGKCMKMFILTQRLLSARWSMIKSARVCQLLEQGFVTCFHFDGHSIKSARVFHSNPCTSSSRLLVVWNHRWLIPSECVISYK